MITAKYLQENWDVYNGTFAEHMDFLNKSSIQYLSYSKVITVERCKKCYKREYIDYEKMKFDAMETGKLIHEAAEIIYNSIKIKGKFLARNTKKELILKHSNKMQQPFVDNGIDILKKNLWDGYEVLFVEKPIFASISKELPIIIGIVDLVLKKNKDIFIIDHKTSKKFVSHDHDQLILYSNILMKQIKPKPYTVNACLDEIRLVENNKNSRKTLFRRTIIPLHESYFKHTIKRCIKAWKVIQQIEKNGVANSDENCPICNGWIN